MFGDDVFGFVCRGFRLVGDIDADRSCFAPILELPKRGARSAGAVELEAAHDLPHNWLLPAPDPSPPLSSRVAGGGGGGAVGGPRGGRGPLSALAGA